jgi:hypothetical protein
MYPDTWVDVTLRDVGQLAGSEVLRYAPWLGVYEGDPHRTYKDFVIPDVRYKNEMAAIRHKGGKLIRLKGVHQPMPTQFAGHSSEQEQKSVPDAYFDAIIVNDADIPTLFERVATVLAL